MNFFIILFLFVVECFGVEKIYFNSQDGLKLHANFFSNGNPSSLVISVHGMQSHAGWMLESGTGEYLSNSNIAVFAFDRRGSGESLGVRGHVDSVEEFWMDLEAAVLKSKSLVPSNTPIHILANCFGSRVVLSFLTKNPRYQDHLRSIIITSPATHMTKRASYNPLQKIDIAMASSINPKAYFKVPLMDEWFTSDERWINFIQSDIYSLRHVTASFLAASNSMTKTMVKSLRHHEVTLPLFVALASRDKIVKNQKIKDNFFNQYPNTDKKLVEYSADHLIDFSESQDQFLRDLINWIESH